MIRYLYRDQLPLERRQRRQRCRDERCLTPVCEFDRFTLTSRFDQSVLTAVLLFILDTLTCQFDRYFDHLVWAQ
jgi:hypothetical protein